GSRWVSRRCHTTSRCCATRDCSKVSGAARGCITGSFPKRCNSFPACSRPIGLSVAGDGHHRAIPSAVAEFVGSALLVTVVVGSGIAAAQLSPADVGLQLLENSTATVFGLAVLILMFGPISGAHFNPVVTAADWLLGRRSGTGINTGSAAAYIVVQTCGAVGGAWLANLMFDRPVFELATKARLPGGPLGGGAWPPRVWSPCSSPCPAPAGPRCPPRPWVPTSAPPTGSPARRRSPPPPSPSGACSPTLSPASP